MVDLRRGLLGPGSDDLHTELQAGKVQQCWTYARQEDLLASDHCAGTTEAG